MESIETKSCDPKIDIKKVKASASGWIVDTYQYHEPDEVVHS